MRKTIFFDPDSGAAWLTSDLPIDYEGAHPVSHFAPIVRYRAQQPYLYLTPLPTASRVPPCRLLAINDSYYVLAESGSETPDAHLKVRANVAIQAGTLTTVGFRIAGGITLAAESFPANKGPSSGEPDISVVVPEELLGGRSSLLATHFARVYPAQSPSICADAELYPSASETPVALCQMMVDIARDFRYPFFARVSAWANLGHFTKSDHAGFWKDASGTRPRYVVVGVTGEGGSYTGLPGLMRRLASKLGLDRWLVSRAIGRAEAQIGSHGLSRQQSLKGVTKKPHLLFQNL